MNLSRLVIFESPDRASPGREDSLMMEGAGQLTGAAAVAFFGKPANLHLEPEKKDSDADERRFSGFYQDKNV
jgi:hypothetical protein